MYADGNNFLMISFSVFLQTLETIAKYIHQFAIQFDNKSPIVSFIFTSFLNSGIQAIFFVIRQILKALSCEDYNIENVGNAYSKKWVFFAIQKLHILKAFWNDRLLK